MKNREKKKKKEKKKKRPVLFWMYWPLQREHINILIQVPFQNKIEAFEKCLFCKLINIPSITIYKCLNPTIYCPKTKTLRKYMSTK